ncbi:FtsB family cell division protein [Dethiosulfatarculus sandiegensis]|uniref:Septation ring formation regulator EzrA n=1 Tax=Dethiosulfatarculus sandiegensis TaxID=1429043 RepID=A0A0D2J1T1_9BACT|nr:septum formation initiator family protein [Dethiosulfatarculus sandiegensis]KIX12179.1 septation ring formation regulator EzrA [Dethiosulfatarculus sandiegensis]
MTQFRQPAIWWPILVFGVLIFSGVAVFRGAQEYLEVKARLKQIQQTNQMLAEKNRLLYQNVIRLRNNPQALEKACRDEMNMVRPGEVVYQRPLHREERGAP